MLYYILHFLECQLFVGSFLYNLHMKNNVVGNKIKELRIEAGISQRKLGDALGFSNQTISFWESGRCEPSLDALVLLAKFFGTTPDYLLGFSEY